MEWAAPSSEDVVKPVGSDSYVIRNEPGVVLCQLNIQF